MSNPVVYLAGPITGTTWQEANEWRLEVREKLEDIGIDSISPLDGKAALLERESSIADHYDHILANPIAITAKDRFSTQNADLVIMNMLGAKSISGGSFIEAGWADSHRVPVILVMESDGSNPNEHAMLNTIASFRTDNLDEAVYVASVLLGRGK